jgi:hypothetical protein
MFLTGTSVQGGPHLRKCTAKRFKFSIHLKNFQQESTLDVDIVPVCYLLEDDLSLCVIKPCDHSKFDLPTDGHEKWHIVDLHDVDI